MPAISNPGLFVQNEDVMSDLDGNFRVFLLSAALSLSARVGHVLPNTAAIVRAVRLARNVSQMEIGRNRHSKTNLPVFAGLSVPSDLPATDRNHRKSGYFSLIANIEQGGRKTAIPPEFVAYLAACAGMSVSIVEAAIAEDAALSTAFAANNPVVPESTETVAKAVSSQSAPVRRPRPEMTEKAKKAERSRNGL